VARPPVLAPGHPSISAAASDIRVKRLWSSPADDPDEIPG